MIKKILLIENNDFLGEILEINLQVYLNAKIDRRKSLREATVFLTKNTPSLIITKDEVNEINLPQMLCKNLANKGIKLPMIIIGENTSKIENAVAVDDPTDLKKILGTAAKILNVTAEGMSRLAVSAYYPVHLKMLGTQFETPCPMYILLADKYEKILDKGEKISQKFLDDMDSSDIMDVYVHAMDRLEVVNAMTHHLFNNLKDESLTVEERIEATGRGFELVQDTVNKVGVDPHTAALAEASIESLNSIVEQIPDLKSLMEKLGTEDQSFRYQHCILNTYIGFKIITQTRWGNKEQQDKFAFVSFFHDITLTKDEHAKVASQEDLEALELPPEEAIKIENHALNAAKVVSRYKKLPMGVDTIIKQHHGSRDGKGFKNLSANISPLAIMFIFAEEWSTLALEARDKNLNLSKDKVMQYLNHKYNVPKYKQFLPLLEKLDL